MKHIFLIHSHTLFLTAVGVIEKEHLKKEDIIFVYSRNYKNSLPYNFKSFDFSKEIEKTFYMLFSWSRRNFNYDKEKRDKIVRFFDDFVASYASEGYYLYVCHLQAYANQILATNTLCKECFFIQEGGRVMTSLITNHIKWFCRLYNNTILRNEKRFWKMTNWFPNELTPYKKSIVAYAFDASYFNNFPRETRIVKWPEIKLDININSDFPIFLLEGAVELGQIEQSVYYDAVKKLITEFAGKRNYIKFHPKQNEKVKTLYLSIFTKLGLEVEELPMDVPFELILTSYKGLKLYGFGTSLLFYGKALGHNVNSKEEYLFSSRRYRSYAKGLQTLPQ